MGDFNLTFVSLDVYGKQQQLNIIKAFANLSLVFVSAVFMQIWSDRRRVWPEIVDLAFKLGTTQIVVLLSTWTA